jgi:hypothetical protein
MLNRLGLPTELVVKVWVVLLPFEHRSSGPGGGGACTSASDSGGRCAREMTDEKADKLIQKREAWW